MAIEDADYSPPKRKTDDSIRDTNNRRGAREWLTCGSKDFMYVCYLAGLDGRLAWKAMLERYA